MESNAKEIGVIDVTPKRFHSFIIVGVHNAKTLELGWRIVGLWGDEEKKEGNRVGPLFPHSDLEQAERVCDELEAKFVLPVDIEKIVDHFNEVQ